MSSFFSSPLFLFSLLRRIWPVKGMIKKLSSALYTSIFSTFLKNFGRAKSHVYIRTDS